MEPKIRNKQVRDFLLSNDVDDSVVTDESSLSGLFKSFLAQHERIAFFGINEKEGVIYSNLPLIKESLDGRQEIRLGLLSQDQPLYTKILKENVSIRHFPIIISSSGGPVKVYLSGFPIRTPTGEIHEALEVVFSHVLYFKENNGLFSSSPTENKYWLYLACNLLPIGIIVVNAKGELVYQNSVAVKLFGKNPLEQVLLPEFSSTPISLQNLVTTLQYSISEYPVRLKRTGKPLSITLFRDKELGNVIITVIPGEPKVSARSTSNWFSSTPQKGLLYSLLQELDDGILIIEKDPRKEPILNPQAQRIIDQAKIIRNPLGRFYSLLLLSAQGDPLPIEELPTSRILNGEAVNETYQLINKDGTSSYVHIIGTPIVRQNEVVSGILSIRDITSSYQEYLAVKKQRGIVEKAIDFLDTAIIIGTIGIDQPLYSNDKAIELFQKYTDGIPSLTHLLLSLTPIEEPQEGGSEEPLDIVTRILATGRISSTRVVDEDGETYILLAQHLSLNPPTATQASSWIASSSEDTTTNFLLLIRPPTPRETMVNQLLNIQNELQAVNDALLLHSRQLYYAEKHIANLARNLQILFSDPMDKLEQLLQVLYDEAIRMADDDTIIADLSVIKEAYLELRNLFKILTRAANTLEFEQSFETIDLRELVRQILRTVPVPEDWFKIDVPPITLYTDPVKLRIGLQNLVSNAIKYANQKKPVIKIKAKQLKTKIVISVQDNGKGLPPNAEKLLFHPFKKLDPSTEGTGIGLYLAKRVISSLGGTITWKNAKQGGAIFSINLPYRTLGKELIR